MGFENELNEMSSTEVENRPKIKLQELPIEKIPHCISQGCSNIPNLVRPFLLNLKIKILKGVTEFYKCFKADKGLQQLNGVPHPRLLSEITR